MSSIACAPTVRFSTGMLNEAFASTVYMSLPSMMTLTLPEASAGKVVLTNNVSSLLMFPVVMLKSTS